MYRFAVAVVLSLILLVCAREQRPPASANNTELLAQAGDPGAAVIIGPEAILIELERLKKQRT